MFAFSHFRVPACVFTAVLPSENPACVLTAFLPSGNAVAFSLQFYWVKTPSRFHCSFTEWKCRCVFTAVLPSQNAVAFLLQFYRVKTPLCFHCSYTEWKRRWVLKLIVETRENTKKSGIKKIPPPESLFSRSVLGVKNATFWNSYEENDLFLLIPVRDNLFRTRKRKISRFSDKKLMEMWKNAREARVWGDTWTWDCSYEQSQVQIAFFGKWKRHFLDLFVVGTRKVVQKYWFLLANLFWSRNLGKQRFPRKIP